MTDPRIEAAARALCIQNGHDPDGQDSYVQSGMDANWCAFVDDAKAALSAADAAAWRPIAEAKKNGSPILAKLRDDIYAPPTDVSSLREHSGYRWNGLTVVLRHPGLADDGFDIGWNMQAPVGHGGFPDDWIEGWQPLPAPPAKSDAVGGGNG